MSGLSNRESRRVRVTLEGEALGYPGSDVLRVFVGASQCVTVDPSWPHVSVEDVAPERVWTDGDVIVEGDGAVWVRFGARWYSTPRLSMTSRADGFMSRLAIQRGSRVLRYQAGDL